MFKNDFSGQNRAKLKNLKTCGPAPSYADLISMPTLQISLAVAEKNVP